MSLVRNAIRSLQDAPAPDFVTRSAIASLVAGARRRLEAEQGADEARFALEMAERPIAEHTDAANEQHYELPPAFFERVLGPRLKYSSALYSDGVRTLPQAEEAALHETCEHADLKDGQSILELGCGWGSLTLWMAETYPNAKITAVSNSHGQRRFIEARAERMGLGNVKVITCDMNDFQATGRFDRVVSVEMFEHMANWRALLSRIHGWLEPDGRLFIHIFTHATSPYRFELSDQGDFIAQHFFTGGVMPSHNLIQQFPDLFHLEQSWRWNGRHYQRTANDWLANFDANEAEIMQMMREVYGDDARLWARRWRRFFMATAGLFGDNRGETWAVSHYRLKPA